MGYDGLTNKGRAHIAKCLAENKPVTFVKAKIGNGNLENNDNPETFTDIKSLKKEVDIAEKVQVEDAVRLLIQIDNKGVKEGYFPREIGIYVQDGEEELLYWYINDGTEASWLPPENKSPVSLQYAINLMATNLDTVIVNWTGTELWVDREFLGKEMAKKVDKTVSVTGTGALQGGGTLGANRQITHKDEKGYKHIPLGGATKQFLKWASDGIAKWGTILWEEIEGKPSALKNPQSLKIKTNGTLKGEYLGDTAKEVNITSADTGGLMKGNLPAIIKDEKTMLDIMENQAGLNFDTSLLYLNDAGTKLVGKLYLDRNKKGLFECIKQTTGTVNSTEFFVEYSIKGNSDRLANLCENNIVLLAKNISDVNLVLPSDISKYRFLAFGAALSGKAASSFAFIFSKLIPETDSFYQINLSEKYSTTGNDYITLHFYPVEHTVKIIEWSGRSPYSVYGIF